MSHSHTPPIAAAEVEINEIISSTIEEDEVSYIELPFSDNGVTITVSVTIGLIVVYASDQITTPNEAFHDWMIETDGYSDVFLDPNDVNRTVGDTVYVAIEGEEESNNYELSTTTGDTSTPSKQAMFFLLPCYLFISLY